MFVLDDDIERRSTALAYLSRSSDGQPLLDPNRDHLHGTACEQAAAEIPRSILSSGLAMDSTKHVHDLIGQRQVGDGTRHDNAVEGMMD
jgi:hypothetical protein